MTDLKLEAEMYPEGIVVGTNNHGEIHMGCLSRTFHLKNVA